MVQGDGKHNQQVKDQTFEYLLKTARLFDARRETVEYVVLKLSVYCLLQSRISRKMEIKLLATSGHVLPGIGFWWAILHAALRSMEKRSSPNDCLKQKLILKCLKKDIDSVWFAFDLVGSGWDRLLSQKFT